MFSSNRPRSPPRAAGPGGYHAPYHGIHRPRLHRRRHRHRDGPSGLASVMGWIRQFRDFIQPPIEVMRAIPPPRDRADAADLVRPDGDNPVCDADRLHVPRDRHQHAGGDPQRTPGLHPLCAHHGGLARAGVPHHRAAGHRAGARGRHPGRRRTRLGDRRGDRAPRRTGRHRQGVLDDADGAGPRHHHHQHFLRDHRGVRDRPSGWCWSQATSRVGCPASGADR